MNREANRRGAKLQEKAPNYLRFEGKEDDMLERIGVLPTLTLASLLAIWGKLSRELSLLASYLYWGNAPNAIFRLRIMPLTYKNLEL